MFELATARRLAAAGTATLASILILGAAGASGSRSLAAYNLYPLVSDSSAVTAPLTDPSLVNGWGLVAGPTTPWWTANNKTNTSTLYSGVGSKTALTVTMAGGPTGIVFNGNASDWLLTQTGASAPTSSRFIFSTQAGTIVGWSAGSTSTTAVDNSSNGAVYDGLAAMSDRLYAADFHNARVDVFDASFKPLTLTNAFADPKIPKGWAPFNIQALGTNLFVTYAKQDAAKKNEVAGGGQGYVDEYNADGGLVARVASEGKANAPLNAPWGLAMAPTTFGAFGGDLLVGNFGNGRISAYQQLASGKWVYRGQLRVANGTPIAVDGLWGIAFGNGAASGSVNNLYVLAGPTGETHGFLGFVTMG